MWRMFWIGAGAVGLLLAAGVGLAVQTTFRLRHPRAPEARIIIDNWTGAAVVAPPRDQAAGQPGSAPASGTPRLVCEQTFYDFGSMPPLTMGRHAFTVRNAGDGELLLKPDSTTCKCTVSGVSQNRVPPGGQAEVVLEWNSGRHHLAFQQSARIKTNDPARPTLELTVAGKVQATAALDPAELSLGSVVAGNAVSTTVVIYSQVWDGLRVVDIQSACEGLSWQTRPLEQPPAEYEARAALTLQITFPAGPKPGRFRHALRITVEPAAPSASAVSAEGGPADASRREHLYLDLEGTVVRPVALYGAVVVDEGYIDLGNVPQGQGKTARIMLKVRDPQQELPNARVTVFPEFLQATLARSSSGAAGLYELTLILPEETPTCQYRSQPIGLLRIDTGHPRIGVIELPVSFAVVPRRRLD